MADFKQRKQIAEKRQAGQIEPEQDVSTGQMINPHNPEFITKRPWYLGDSGPSLTHHSKQQAANELSMKDADALLQSKWEEARRAKQTATGFRKGACANCGAMGHKTAECVERPRSNKKAAWKTGLDIAPDDMRVELEQYGNVKFDAKRDRWQGYHPDQHKEVVERFQRIDDERRRRKLEEQQRHEEEKQKKLHEKEERAAARAARRAAAAALTASGASGDGEGGASGEGGAAAAGGGGGGGAAVASGNNNGKGPEIDSPSEASDSDSDYDSDDDDDDDDDNREFVQKEVDQRDFQGRVARQGGLGGAQMKTTVRNLRIREDRAKYLYNLNPDSAYYDPKTRAMRDNPVPGTKPDEVAFAGDNFVRYGGDVKKYAQTQIFAWEAAERGQELHPVADPSQAELLHRQFEEKKKKLKDDQKQGILDKYGGEEHWSKPDARLVMGQTEAYVEYDRTGRVVKGVPRATARSKYEEDVFPNNHTAVWGSYYDRRGGGRWGFACCHSAVRNSYCTGEGGREANDESNASALGIDAGKQRQMLEARPAAERRAAGEAGAGGWQAAPASRADLFGSGAENPELDPGKLREAVQKEAAFQKKAAEVDDRKRKYNSMKSSEVTVEEMEAYRMNKPVFADPMAGISSDVLLDDPDDAGNSGGGGVSGGGSESGEATAAVAAARAAGSGSASSRAKGKGKARKG